MNNELARKLEYTFNDLTLLKLALTHRSSHEKNNERLEFLGDSIVNFIMAEALFDRFPKAQEGDLSRWRSTLVNRETLGEIARNFDVGRYMFLGQGELKSGGNARLSILSCAMEAIIGAIYLDGGFESIKKCLLHWYDDLLNSLPLSIHLKDPKTQLQEYLQNRRLPLPVYSVERIEGEAHQQLFTVSCSVEGFGKKITGTGTSRRRAEQAAAEMMLGIIKNE